MDGSITKYLKSFGSSFTFDLHQSMNLFLLPIKVIVVIFHDGMEKVHHRPQRTVKKMSPITPPATQRLEDGALRVVSLLARQNIGSSVENTVSVPERHSAQIIPIPLNTTTGALSGLSIPTQSANHGAVA